MNRVHIQRTPIIFAVMMALALAAVTLATLFYPVEAQDGSVPAKPTGLAAQASHDSVTLTWDDPDDDSITSYVVLRRNIAEQDPGEFTTVAANTGSAATAHTDDGVEPETHYAYRIKAINAHGTSPRSGYVNVETEAAPTPNETPEPATTGQAHGPDRHGNPRHGAPHLGTIPTTTASTGYVILRRNRDTTAEGEFTELVSDTGNADTSYTDHSVAAETPYTYRIKAINEHGTSERSRWLHIDTRRLRPLPRRLLSSRIPTPTISPTARRPPDW